MLILINLLGAVGYSHAIKAMRVTVQIAEINLARGFSRLVVMGH